MSLTFHGRAALQLENDALRVTVLNGGGHIAEILYKKTGINPLWIPPWPSIEPAEYDPARHMEYGPSEEGKLLCGIMGHNLCFDSFGPPSPEEFAKGISVHGEAAIATYQGETCGKEMHLSALLRASELRIARTISLDANAPVVQIRECVENVSATDRPIAWTQHVTLGPPFLEPGATQFAICSERSRTFESPGFDAGSLVRGADFCWPSAPTTGGGVSDLRSFAANGRSASYTAHLMGRGSEKARFLVYSPSAQLLVGYEWRWQDFPWLGIWEENKSRPNPPWCGRTVACGMEFGVSPFPETKQQMVARGELFGVPTFRCLRARERICVEYSAFIRETWSLPSTGTEFLQP